MKRTFQLGNRFWAVERAGRRLTTAWGITGGKAQSRTGTLPSAGAAEAEQARQARAKLRAGYAETTFRGGLPLGDPVARGLIAALADDPDDLASSMALADWLSEQADDRLTAWGEFMRLQLAAEGRPPGRRKTPEQRRMDELLERYEAHWLGEDLARALLPQFWTAQEEREFRATAIFGPALAEREYRRGWLAGLRIPDLTGGVARALKGAESLRLLRRLEVLEYADRSNLRLLAGSPVLANVRHLAAGLDDERADVAGLVRGMPRLEALQLGTYDARTDRLFAAPMPALRTLEVSCGNYAIQQLADNPSLRGLRRLALDHVSGGFIEADDYDQGMLDDAQLGLVCRSPNLGGLEELVIHYGDFHAPGCSRLVESGVMARLKLLDLSYCELDDEAAEILADSPDFARVGRVLLHGNYFSERMVRRLKRLNKGVEAEEQENSDYEDDWE